MAEARSARRIVYSVLTIVRAGHNEQVRLGFSDGSDAVLVLADDAVLNSFDFPEVVTTSAPSPTPSSLRAWPAVRCRLGRSGCARCCCGALLARARRHKQDSRGAERKGGVGRRDKGERGGEQT